MDGAPKILLVNGPNLNRLGSREPDVYGVDTLTDIVQSVEEVAMSYGAQVMALQSNHEGDLIDFIQTAGPSAMGMVINPGALAHYGYALRDTIVDIRVPTIEVHISNVHRRESFRHRLVLADIVIGQIIGLGTAGYVLATTALCQRWMSAQTPKERNNKAAALVDGGDSNDFEQ